MTSPSRRNLTLAARTHAAAREAYILAWRACNASPASAEGDTATARAAEAATAAHLDAQAAFIARLEREGLAAFRDGLTLYVRVGPMVDRESDVEDFDGEDRIIAIDLSEIGHAARPRMAEVCV
jgi:hypothetical protein